jgi:hypothetical protein
MYTSKPDWGVVLTRYYQRGYLEVERSRERYELGGAFRDEREVGKGRLFSIDRSNKDRVGSLVQCR